MYNFIHFYFQDFVIFTINKQSNETTNEFYSFDSIIKI